MRYEECDRCKTTGKIGELDLQLFQVGGRGENSALYELCHDCTVSATASLHKHVASWSLENLGG